jgi:hypothetical protein
MIPLPPGVRVWLATGDTDMRKGFPSSVKGGFGRRDALLGPTAGCSIFSAAKIVDIALTSSSTARFSPVDSQESLVSILRASRHVFGLTRNTLPFQDVRSGLSAWFVHRIF